MVELSEGKKGVKAPKYKIHSMGTAAKDSDDGKKTPAKKAVADKKVKEDPNEGNAFGKAVRDAKADGVQKGEKVKVGGKTYPVKEASKPDADKNGIPDYAEDGKGKNDLKKKDKKVKEGFPTVADAKARAEKEKTTGKFDKKETSTGTVYTRKSNTFTDGGDDSDTKKAKKAAKLKEAHSIYKRHVAIVNESLAMLLAEDEEGKAKAITAAGDMVNDYTSWMQRVGQYQTKTMIELADAIKADFGAAEAEAFKQAVGPALSATLEVLTQQREAVSNAVAVLAGEATPETPMGMEPSMDMPPEPGMDAAAPDEMNAPAPAGDEFGASDAAAGTGTTGREMRESRFARKLAESHSIMSKLAK